MSCETKLTSGNEADRNQSAMREVEIKTATERDKNPWPLPPTYRRLLGNTEDGVSTRRAVIGILGWNLLIEEIGQANANTFAIWRCNHGSTFA